MDHITKSIPPGRIVLTCEICGRQVSIDAYKKIAEIDRLMDDFEERHEHLSKRNIDCSLSGFETFNL